MIPDFINGAFELCGSVAVACSCWALYRAKQVKGFSALHLLYFTLWGLWNLYYYPSLGQWLSFYGGLGVVTTNLVYLRMIFYYGRPKEVAPAYHRKKAFRVRTGQISNIRGWPRGTRLPGRRSDL